MRGRQVAEVAQKVDSTGRRRITVRASEEQRLHLLNGVLNPRYQILELDCCFVLKHMLEV